MKTVKDECWVVTLPRDELINVAQNGNNQAPIKSLRQSQLQRHTPTNTFTLAVGHSQRLDGTSELREQLIYPLVHSLMAHVG